MINSNKITLIDNAEPTFLENNGLTFDISSGYELKYTYNYYVQDECINSSIESSLIDAYGRKYSIASEETGQQRPITYIKETNFESTNKNPNNYPRYIKIILPSYSIDSKIQSLISGPDPLGNNFTLDYQTFNQVVLKNISDELLENSLENLINFEESLTFGLYDTSLKFDNRNEKTGVFLNKFFNNNFENKFNDFLKADQIENIKKVQDIQNKNFSISFLDKSFGAIYSFFNNTYDSNLIKNSINSINRNFEYQLDAINSISNEELDSINDGKIRKSNNSTGNGDLEIKTINFDLFNEPENGKSLFSFIPVGFLIKRKDLGSTKSNDILSPDEYLPIVGLQSKEIFDLGIKHGRKYSYEIRVLNLVRYYSGNYNLAPQKLSFLLASSPLNPKKSNQIITRVEAYPNSVIDININKKQNNLLIDWQIPNKKNGKDIVKFLILERNKIEEPYKLITSLKFDKIQENNSTNQDITGIRNFNKNLSVELNKSSFYEYENFPFNSGKILTIISVDVHGELSLCSTQIFVNVKNGNINKEIISKFGAPLQYPNLFIEKKFGGFYNNSINSSYNIFDSVLTINDFSKIKIIPTFGACTQFLSKVINKNLIKFKIENSFVPIVSVEDENLIPISVGPNNENRIIMNIISINKEESKNVNIYFK